jgi:hypothetical protein
MYGLLWFGYCHVTSVKWWSPYIARGRARAVAEPPKPIFYFLAMCVHVIISLITQSCIGNKVNLYNGLLAVIEIGYVESRKSTVYRYGNFLAFDIVRD